MKDCFLQWFLKRWKAKGKCPLLLFYYKLTTILLLSKPTIQFWFFFYPLILNLKQGSSVSKLLSFSHFWFCFFLFSSSLFRVPTCFCCIFEFGYLNEILQFTPLSLIAFSYNLVWWRLFQDVKVEDEVRACNRRCCEWIRKRNHCKQCWCSSSILWSSCYLYQNWYLSLSSKCYILFAYGTLNLKPFLLIFRPLSELWCWNHIPLRTWRSVCLGRW